MRSRITLRNGAGRIFLSLALAWAAAGVAPAAALMLKVPLEESVRNSELVIRGRTLDQRCEWTEDGRWIMTVVRVQVLETLGGRVPGAELDVRVPGGELDGLGMRVSDMPRFENGEESVLLLHGCELDGRTFVVTDNFQGKNTLREGRVLERDLPESEFVNQVRALAGEYLR